MIPKCLFRLHLIRPAVWVGATVAVSLAYSPEAAAQGKKGGQVDIGDTAGGQPGFPGSGGAAPANQGPAKLPAYKLTPRKYKDAVIEPTDDLASGAPFNVKKFFSLPADTDNAAPLVLDALAELPEVYAAVAADGTSKDEFEKGLKERKDRLDAAQAWMTSNPNPRQWDANAIEQAFEGYRVLFAKLHDAHKKADCVIASPLVAGAPPHVPAAIIASRIAPVLIYADLARGDRKGAIEKFNDILLLGIDLQARAGSAASLAITAMHAQTLGLTLPILLNSRLTEQDCDAILAALKTYRESSLNLLPEMIKAEYINQAAMMTMLSKPGGFSSMLEAMPSKPAELANVDPKMVEGILGTLLTPDNAKKINTAMGVVIKDQLTAIDEVGSPEEVAALGKKLTDIQTKGTKDALASMFNKDTIANLSGKGDESKAKAAAPAINPTLLMGAITAQASSNTPDFQPIVNGLITYQTQQSMMEALTAARRWYLSKKATTNGKTLDEVAKEAKLEAAPLDSFSGKPLKLIWTGSGPAVYSVGPDRKDDDGKLLFGSIGEDQKPSAKGDIIVTLALGGNPLGAPGEGGAAGAGAPGGFGGQPGAPAGYGGQPGSGGPPQAIAPGPGGGGRRGRNEGSSGGGPPQAIAPGPGGRGGSSGAPGGASQAVSPR
jgi:hypothetical protein